MSEAPRAGASKRIVLVHRYYVPDVATYGRMLARFADHLVAQGHEVTVLCGPTGYRQALDEIDRAATNGVVVKRFKGVERAPRSVDFLLFACNVLRWSVQHRRTIDVISASTMPPIIMGLVLRIIGATCRPVRTVYHCMDIHPEVLGLAKSRPARAIRRILRDIDRRSMHSMDEIIVLSSDMQRTIQARGPIASTIANNFALEPIESATPDLDWGRQPGVARLVFAGNLGRFQGLESLCDAVELANTERDIELVFAGAGPLSAELARRAELCASIKLFDHMPIQDAMSLTIDADAAIVSLSPGVIRCSYPSKMLMLLELGTPVLAVVEADSELATFVEDEGLGVVIEPDDPPAAARAMIKLIDMDSDRTRIQELGRQLHGTERALDRWTAAYLG